MGVHGHHFFDAYANTPYDAEPRSRFTPETVESGVEIRCGDIWIDAIGTYAQTGTLLSVEVNGKRMSPEAVTIAMLPFGECDAGWDDDLDDVRLNELLDKGAADAADEYGDWLHDQRTYDD